MEFQPYPKQQQVRSKRKTIKRNFDKKTKLEIFDRDGWRCVKCGSYRIMAVPHHIVYKSQGGLGEKRNGATVCYNCHSWAHHLQDSVYGEPSSEGKQWFEDWQKNNLDEKGDLK